MEHSLEQPPVSINFAEEERKTLQGWAEERAFERSLELSEGKPKYTFYDGPPFATGLPHYGHILAGTIKDTVTRYAHQTGHHVERRFGWDCHGLPVEYEIDQKLGIKGRDDVLAMGIDKYNAECRSIVTRYTSEWETTVTRLGRWIDFKNDYKTMDTPFMESVWWVFKTLFEKGLVYRGYKVMPFSTGCCTALSNFEAGLNYKDAKDPSITIAFKLKDEEETYALAWTSTPWTLPSNLALCVNPELDYVKLRDAATGRTYIVAEPRIVQLYPVMGSKKWKPAMAADLFTILEKMKGAALAGKAYEPLFPYYASRSTSGAFRILTDGYVTSSDGTGIVHQAPGFGEDDYRVCLAASVIDKSEEVPCPVDSSGRFMPEIVDFAGRYIKDADSDICAALKAAGLLVHKEAFVHSYPFCWRSDSPLIYKAVPSWFVRVEEIKERLLANNEKTYWVPSFVKEKRFHNWLSEARDWAISRARFWGTPIPLWSNEDRSEIIAVGSVEELERLSGAKVTDLHRDYIDDIEIPSPTGKGTLRRIDEVFDCWFESGSMPYAQQHYPFENKDLFERSFPADFIAEGLDQTRGWFYTLTVLSTALFDQPAFKNLIVNGLVLAEDGKKMSKRLKNYPDPTTVVDKYGADALRLYLINSPVVRAEPLRFSEAGVKGVLRDVIVPWYNASCFFVQEVRRWELECAKKFTPTSSQSTNIMDVWISASLQSLVQFVHQEMQGYRLYTVVPRLVAFVGDLCNWYVRLNRPRLKGRDGTDEASLALSCLLDVLVTSARIMSPFTPFFSEFLYKRLQPLLQPLSSGGPEEVGTAASVHHIMLPAFDPLRIDPQAESDMRVMQQVIEMGRTARERRNVTLKTPIKGLTIITQSEEHVAALKKLEGYVKSELNTWHIEFSAEQDKWLTLSALPNLPVVAKRLGKNLKTVKTAIAGLSNEQLQAYLSSGSIEIEGHTLTEGELLVTRNFTGDSEVYEAEVNADSTLTVLLDLRKDEGILREKITREVSNRVQRLRKKCGLRVGDRVEVFFESRGYDVEGALSENTFIIQQVIGSTPLPLRVAPPYAVVLGTSEDTLDEGCSICIKLMLPSLVPGKGLAAKAQAAGLDVGAVELLMASLDLDRVRSLTDGLTIELDGKKLAVTPGKDFFLSALEKVAVEADESLRWAWA